MGPADELRCESDLDMVKEPTTIVEAIVYLADAINEAAETISHGMWRAARADESADLRNLCESVTDIAHAIDRFGDTSTKKVGRGRT